MLRPSASHQRGIAAVLSAPESVRSMERVSTGNGRFKFQQRAGVACAKVGGGASVGNEGYSSTTSDLWALASVVGTGLGAFHGYARNQSIGWAIAWGFLGGIAPIITIPVAFAQGFGKPA
jgi:hypothetical protein